MNAFWWEKRRGSYRQQKIQKYVSKASQIAEDLRDGKLENEIVTVEVTEQSPSIFDAMQGGGMEHMGMNMQDALSNLMPKKKKKRKMTVKDARKVLTQEEASKLIDNDEISQMLLKKQSNQELSLLMKWIKLQVEVEAVLLQMFLEKEFNGIFYQL